MTKRLFSVMFAVLFVSLVSCAGCTQSAPEGSATDRLNMAPPLAPGESTIEIPSAEKDAEEEESAAEQPAGEEPAAAATESVDLQGMTFAAPEGWNRNPNPTFVEAEFALPGEDGDARMTIMAAGGDKQSNIDRWIGQFQQAPGEEASVSEIDVDGEKATMVDIRGAFKDMRPGSPVQENQRMLGFIIPFTAQNNYFVKVTGPQSTVEKHADAVIEFVKSGKTK